jgi:hypothetical protein
VIIEMMLLAAVFFLSYSSLFYEILLARYYSIAQWNHLSFMVISIALFGFAASGVFLNLFSLKKKKQIQTPGKNEWIPRIIIFFSLSTAGSYCIVNAVPIDYFRIPFEYMQTVYLLLSFLLLSLPFFFSGLLSALAYSTYPEKSGIIYFVSMTGSTLGAVSPFPGLPFLGIGGSILVAAVIPLFLLISSFKKMWIKSAWVCAIICVLAGSFFIRDTPVVRVSPSPYKTLPQLLQRPDSRIEQTHHIIQGRIDYVTCPSIRYVPGLSLTYSSGLPEQAALLKDADVQITLYTIDPGDPPDLPQFTLPYAGYNLFNPPKNVLILQKDGGTAVLSGLASGARDIVLCEEHPVAARYIREKYKTPRLTVVNMGHRELMDATRQHFDIIHVENWGSSVPGMASLTSEYLYTREAMCRYIDLLTEDGVLIIPKKLLLPPSDSLRILLSALTALQAKGYTHPEEHIMMIQHWDIYTLLLSRRAFCGEKLEKVKKFCSLKNFDLLYYKGITPEETGRFIQSLTPYHFNEIQALVEVNSDRSLTASRYFLDILPQNDNRPFHNKYMKLEKLTKFFKSTGSRFYTLILSGEIIVWVIMGAALFVTLLILILPVLLIPGREKHVSFSQVLYFLAVGAGFMFLEVAFIQEFTLLSGDPVVSFSFVLCAILVFSGIGGYFSSRGIHPSCRYPTAGINSCGQNTLAGSFIILLVFIGIVFIGMDTFVHFLLPVPVLPRFLLMGITMFPISLLMGVPFPFGIQTLLFGPSQRAYSWAANGCTSVLASIISVPIAMSCGIHVLFLAGFISYGIAFTMMLIIRRKG